MSWNPMNRQAFERPTSSDRELHHPSPGGGRTPVRPDRDPEHDPAHHRPALRVPRPAVRQDTRGHDPQPAPRPGPRLRRPAAVDTSQPYGPATYVLTVSRAEAAAPAANRALVAAGADAMATCTPLHRPADAYP